MSHNEAPNNVIQFPGKKRETVEQPTRPQSPPAKPAAQAKRPAKSKRTVGGVLAIGLLTAMVNHYAFAPVLTTDFSSQSSRGIASVESGAELRDAAWEKMLAESLASSQIRTLATVGVGHEATAEEKLRWGTLEEKYTILYQPKAHVIDTITLQDSSSTPSYILDRENFMRTYGSLFAENFGSAKLKSVEVGHDKTIEDYTIFDHDQRPKGQARFELDMHKRLLSLKVQPEQI
jgi:hypothetical protein